MAYSELIKNFERVRDYMREFYVYGFKSREEYKAKSARSYDNERRRIESWLEDYMSFRQDANGKNIFLSVDSRTVAHNPLYKAFKAKSFTNNDIKLHFYLLDLLSDGSAKSAREITDCISDIYLGIFDEEDLPDESTVRKKLKEYEKLGLLCCSKRGREKIYRLAQSSVDPDSWKEAAAFFSEAAPLGVIGSYLLDKYEEVPEYFRFKHHYILQALDSQILYECLAAMGEKRTLYITVHGKRMKEKRQYHVLPLKIYASTQNGRYYLLANDYRFDKRMFFRLDSIKKTKAGPVEAQYEDYLKGCETFSKHLWGVSTGRNDSLDHIEMTIRAEEGEAFIVSRLEREKRNGRVERIDAVTYRFTADVYDATEMLPWLRTFIGRIIKLECSNSYVTETFYSDLRQMEEMYGGGGDDVS
ncbi:WYL domain-containing protein [Anaerovorax odorimutans]|uniref:WYL domain-containing protein n=1 Tax=Anaerovorax odorimutans TaxID=109327 RepID=A0ABT1RR95_9FIRM|nr:WYL domain-containing protein [Anaerovorax odorimutans]MCQ4637712.1 WYL domain-containing protein [Anaerovorax odorimutans]